MKGQPSPFARPMRVLGQILPVAVLGWIGLHMSTRCLGGMLLLVLLPAALLFWRFRRALTLAAFSLAFIAEFIPVDISFVRGPGAPHLAPYVIGMRIGAPVVVKPDGTLQDAAEVRGGVVVCRIDLRNPPKYVVVW